jgi:hypothetical protein
MAWPRLGAANAQTKGRRPVRWCWLGGTQMMRKLMLGTALCVALGLALSAETASAKAGDPSAQRPACRLAAAAPPLKLLRSAVLVEGSVSLPVERISRRAIYTPVPNGANAREQVPFLVLLERQSRPTGLMVGVGF